MNNRTRIPATAMLICGLLGFSFLQSCGSGKPDTTTPETVTTETFTDGARMQRLMEYMAADERGGRDSGSDGIAQAAAYIIDEFEAAGVEPFFNSYRDTLRNYDVPSYNVVGAVPGSDPELKDDYIIIGAHYDHIGILPGNPADSIANGANDNASGTITVMELARYFGKARTNKRTLVFALFSAEEKGLLGSRHMAERMAEEGMEPYLVLNYEMTGIPLEGKDYLVYMTGYKLSDLATTMNEIAGEKLVGFLPQAEEYNLFKRSDNYPFYEQFKMPAHTFCTFDFTNFDHYHKVGDEAHLMNGEHMARVVRSMIPVIEELASGEAEVEMQ